MTLKNARQPSLLANAVVGGNKVQAQQAAMAQGKQRGQAK
jgi:hypothetical protein